MNIAIIGAGWYGCHIAAMLKDQCTKLTIYEKNNYLLSEASGNNQFRLHQGLHYARSSATRIQSRDGFLRFSERYPFFAKKIEKNYYLIPKYASNMDFDTYFSIMFSSGLKIEKTSLNNTPYLMQEKFEGIISCDERLILTSKARNYFNVLLKDNLVINCTIKDITQDNEIVYINGEKYNYVVDATWGSLNTSENKKLYYEVSLLLYYTKKNNQNFPAITLVDGELWSIYPTEDDKKYTLSSVKHTPLKIFNVKNDAYYYKQQVNNSIIESVRLKMEEEVKMYFPSFDDHFKYESPQLSIKTKPYGKSDDRSASVYRNSNIFIIQSGKIDNIFQVADFIQGEIHKDNFKI